MEDEAKEKLTKEVWEQTLYERKLAVELVVMAHGTGLSLDVFRTEVNKMYNYLLKGKYE